MRLYEVTNCINVYHGSPHKISTFVVDEDRGVYFASDIEYAKGYGQFIYKCQVCLDNPIIYSEKESQGDMEIDRNILITRGYDGRIIKYDDGELDVIAFYQHQITKI